MVATWPSSSYRTVSPTTTPCLCDEARHSARVRTNISFGSMLTDRLAIDGGPPVRTTFPPLGKGVDLIGDEEIDAVTAVLRDRSLFRYHGPRTPSRVTALEAAASDAFGSAFCLASSSGTAALRCAL